MSSEITNQVEELFQDKEQWKSFVILVSEKDTITEDWFVKLKPGLNECFARDNLVEGWEFYSEDDNFRWYLKDFGNESLYIYLQKCDENWEFGLYVNKDNFNAKKVSTMLREKKYLPIISAFDRLDYYLEDDNNNCKIKEFGNFVFGDSNDGDFGFDDLAWYANYKTDEFIAQILSKVDKFRKNEKITKLFYEINEATKKKSQKK